MVSYMSNDHDSHKQLLLKQKKLYAHWNYLNYITAAGSQKVELVRMRTRRNDLPILFAFCQYNYAT